MKIIIENKSPSVKAKGLESLGSPYWSASELLRGI